MPRSSPSREASSHPPIQPSPSRCQRAAHLSSSFTESDYPLSDFPVRRSDADVRGLPSRSSWFSQCRISLPQTNGSGSDPYNYLYLNLASPEFPSPTDSMRRNSATSEHTNSWRGLSTVANAANLADMPVFERSAEWSQSLGHDHHPWLASSPPHGSFTLFTPDFSPVFDSFLERIESSLPVSPHGGAHTHSVFGQPGSHADLHHFHRVIRPPTPLPPVPVWEARPRQPSPH